MIAPRKDILTASDTEVADARAAMRRLTAPMTPAYGTWRNFHSAAEAVLAVISEIGEVVLARTIAVSAQDCDAALLLTISNRHLVALEGISLDASNAEAQDVVAAIERALDGAKSLRFDIAARTPEMPSSARSWSCQALLETLEAPHENTVTPAIIADVKALSVAWLEAEVGVEAGPDAALRALHHMAKARGNFVGQVDQFRQDRPHLALFSMTEQIFAVEVSWQGNLLLAICEASTREDLLAMWRGLVAET
ncbi:hypothetical protein [uncultured Shimia sp.]|uniref:hypothetical protein n=1 Tax=uncultured Shimia sp. TaxID=573152 RepID=UPI002627D35E|nr:hypothetical protein [uncultured Shimia sp.]